MSQFEISGIGKIPPRFINIDPASFINADELATSLELTPLAPEKFHVTLLHQSVGGLKQLTKLFKKYSKGKKLEDPCVYPSTTLPEIDTEGAEVIVVDDQNPKTGEERRTVRIVLRDELQQVLEAWVSQFCELNGLERDEVEMQRVYHISYANRTGNPSDSVR